MPDQATLESSPAPTATRRPLPPPARRGEEHHAAVLTADDVTLFREFVREGAYGVSDIAKITGHPRSTIENAIRGRSWGHLPGAVTSLKGLTPPATRPKAAKAPARDTRPAARKRGKAKARRTAPRTATPRAAAPTPRTPALALLRGVPRAQLAQLVIQGIQALIQPEGRSRRRRAS